MCYHKGYGFQVVRERVYKSESSSNGVSPARKLINLLVEDFILD